MLVSSASGFVSYDCKQYLYRHELQENGSLLYFHIVALHSLFPSVVMLGINMYRLVFFLLMYHFFGLFCFLPCVYFCCLVPFSYSLAVSLIDSFHVFIFVFVSLLCYRGPNLIVHGTLSFMRLLLLTDVLSLLAFLCCTRALVFVSPPYSFVPFCFIRLLRAR